MVTQPRSASDHPATGKFDYPIFHAETRADWRAWLAANHDRERGVWLCWWKPATRRPAVTYEEAVLEALCYGWIDSTMGTLDDERRLQLVTPRRPRSTWTRLNRRRIAELEEAGLMTPAGRRAVAVARDNGWWTIYEPVEALEVPDDLATALARVPDAEASWVGFPPSAKKQMLWWVLSAMQQATRDRRVEAIVESAARGERAQG